ncbi:squalene/phytoene synthase family protein [Seohaeicola nanhaiensis]|uniref:Squalene/phytoene synthase family protein n=1 Tax=Seohaeicola nanhaiensis TaxID=1387282 RepID=A0ABV9KEX0_9RHOB
MAFDADLIACAALVERADPERFLATMAAPVAARRVLFPLYAMNVEVSRAPWVTAEAMIAEMRLQWWRDALGEIAVGGTVRRHEVVTPLAAALRPALAEVLDEVVAARRWDIYQDPFEDAGDFARHIERTSGTLLWVAAASLGQADEEVVRDLGFAAGVANWLRAVPELAARGRIPLLDGTPEGIRGLARGGLMRLQRAQARRDAVSPEAAPALLAAWQAGPVLARAESEPHRVAEGRLSSGPLAGRITLALRTATGRW